MKLLLNENTLSQSASQWSTSPKFILTSKTVSADLGLTNQVSLDISFDSLPEESRGSAELMTEIEIVQANSVYKLSLCLTYSMPSGSSLNGLAPVNVYLRQRSYPYKKLTTVETLSVAASSTGQSGCQSVAMKTLDKALVTDLKNYAMLVFDLAPKGKISLLANQSVEGGIEVLFKGLSLTNTKKLPAIEYPTTYKSRDVERQVPVEKGWVDKVNSANVGFGIIIGILCVTILSAVLLLCINYSRILRIRKRMQALQTELKDIDD